MTSNSTINSNVSNCINTSTASNAINITSTGTAANTYTIHTGSPYYNDVLTTTTNINPWTVEISGQSLEDYIKDICKSYELKSFENELKSIETTKENTKMKAFGKFNFGPITDGSVAMSMYGVAVKNTAGEYVVYDENKDEIISVDGLTFDGTNMIFAMPVALKNVQMGDVIIHNKHYCYVMDGDENLLQIIDITDGSVKEIMPTKSPFGFNFVTKVASLVDMGKASADSPFGDNFLAYMMMANGGIDKKMLPFVLMMQKDQKMDPMLMMALMST